MGAITMIQVQIFLLLELILLIILLSVFPSYTASWPPCASVFLQGCCLVETHLYVAVTKVLTY